MLVHSHGLWLMSLLAEGLSRAASGRASCGSFSMQPGLCLNVVSGFQGSPTEENQESKMLWIPGEKNCKKEEVNNSVKY